MKPRSYCRINLILLFASLAALVISCCPVRMTSDYPPVFSLQSKKPGLPAKSWDRHKPAKPGSADLASYTPEQTNENPAEYNLVEPGKSSRSPVPALAEAVENSGPQPGTYPRKVTASLSAEPDPDLPPLRLICPGAGSRIINKSNPPAIPKPSTGNSALDSSGNGGHPENFAIVSLVSALVFILALFANLPALALLSPVAAIVFGALGLKSSKHKMALAGLILGIIEMTLIILAAVILILFLSSFPFLFSV